MTRATIINEFEGSDISKDFLEFCETIDNPASQSSRSERDAYFRNQGYSPAKRNIRITAPDFDISNGVELRVVKEESGLYGLYYRKAK